MSHIVIHDDNDNITQYRQFDDLQAAAAHLEALHNMGGITGARLFALDEVQFAVRSYVKVEIGAAAPATVAAPAAELGSTEEDDTPNADTADEAVEYLVADSGDDEDVTFVEASMQSADAGHASGRQDLIDDPIVSGEPRRGLFGR